MLIEFSDVSSPEEGMAKGVTDKVRMGSQIADVIPLDFIPGLGTAISEVSASVAAGIAGAVDVGAKALEFDIGGACEELFRSVGRVGAILIPFAELGKTAGVVNLREEFANAAGGAFNWLLGRESTVKPAAAAVVPQTAPALG